MAYFFETPPPPALFLPLPFLPFFTFMDYITSQRPFGRLWKVGICIFFLAPTFFYHLSATPTSPQPLRVAVVGLTHTHVHWILGRADKGDIKIVGVSESNRELAIRYFHQYDMDTTILYQDMEEMLDAVKPDAVTAFNSIFEHLEVVQACAPRGIHVMVEKPLAVSLDHAHQMEKLAKEAGIHLLTNYETTWYGTIHEAYEMIYENQAIGDIRKLVIHDGHKGPKEIGCNTEFLDWLTDPVMNGGGALIDFGCYGANLATWYMKGEKPLSVTAITQQIKPEVYPKVDDEATIILTYPKAQAILQASWNWPFNRKDIEIYGLTGYIRTIDGKQMYVRLAEAEAEEIQEAEPLFYPTNDPFTYLAQVVQGHIQPKGELSSLEINMVVVEILDAARESAEKGETIYLRH